MNAFLITEPGMLYAIAVGVFACAFALSSIAVSLKQIARLIRQLVCQEWKS